MKSKGNEFRQIAGYFAADLPLPMQFIAEFLAVDETQLIETLLAQNLLLQLPVGFILAAQPDELPPPDPKSAMAVSEAVIGRLSRAFRDHNKVQRLAAFQSLGPHIVTLIEKLEPFALDNQWELLSLMARYLMLVGKAADACDYFHQAIRHFPATGREGNPAFDQLRLQTAEAETACGNTKTAANLVKQVITEQEQANGYPSPLLLVKLAHIRFQEAAYTQAIGLYQQAIQQEVETGNDANLLATHWNNLGRVYLADNQAPEAIGAFSTAAELWRNTPDSEHHINRALALKNLALAYQEQQKFSDAQAAIEEAIQLSESAYGKDHPDIGRDANIYASILQAQGKNEAALAQFRRALRVDTRSFGKYHPEVGLTLNNMGVLYAEMGRLDKARQCLEEARGILAQCSNESHPYWQQVTENIERII